MPSPCYMANGTIEPCRFVKLDTSVTPGFKVIQAAAATDPVIGISQEGSQDPPGVTGAAADAARQGNGIRVFGQGEVCLLCLGSGGCTVGDKLVSDANGKGVTATIPTAGSVNFIGAIALETGSAGDLVRVQVTLLVDPVS